MVKIVDEMLNRDNCAVLVVDMLNDFMLENAPLEIPEGREIAPKIKELLGFVRERGIPVIYIQEKHRRGKVDFGRGLDREPVRCVEGTNGAEIYDLLKPDEKKDYIVVKRRFSGFYDTDLELLLKGLRKKIVLVTGMATNMCVYATAMDAVQRDFYAVIIEDCVTGTSHTSKAVHQAYLENFKTILGEVTDSDHLKEILK